MSESEKNNELLNEIKNEEGKPLNEIQSEIVVINKNINGPINCEYEDVDIESINIDDIFNENQHQEGWSDSKDLFVNTHSYSGEINHAINSSSMSLIQPQQSRLQFDNKYFLITDILNNEKFYHNQEKLSENISFVLNNNFVTNNTLINNNFPFVKPDSDIPLCVNSFDSGLSYTLTESQSVSLNITRNKAILPMVGSSPNKKQFGGKLGKGSEQLCLVCCDIGTGKHYGVLSCEGCKGFFKRTIRNNLTYKCRDFNICSVDKKFRNRCQACRFQKCLSVGMKRDGVQIEKVEKRCKKYKINRTDAIFQSPSLSAPVDESLEKIHSDIVSQINSDKMLLLEQRFNPDVEDTDTFQGNAMKVISEVVNDHLFSIVTWAKYVPGFASLDVSDQTLLLKMCWGELVIANFTHRSIKLNADVILLRNGSKLIPEIAEQSGIGKLIERIIFEILHQFRDLKIDRCELGFMKAIVLFNPNLKDLIDRPFVKLIRDKLYSSLQNYCLTHYPHMRYRFSKLLLRLPSLRSIAHITLDHFRLYDIVNKARLTTVTDDNSENSVDSDNNGRLFDFFNEMLQHTDIILDH